jgi:hypothetical protein
VVEKASDSISKTGILEVLRLRAIHPLLGDGSARRFAQDDGLVGGLKKNNRLVLMGRGAWVRVRTLEGPPRRRRELTETWF